MGWKQWAVGILRVQHSECVLPRYLLFAAAFAPSAVWACEKGPFFEAHSEERPLSLSPLQRENM